MNHHTTSLDDSNDSDDSDDSFERELIFELLFETRLIRKESRAKLLLHSFLYEPGNQVRFRNNFRMNLDTFNSLLSFLKENGIGCDEFFLYLYRS